MSSNKKKKNNLIFDIVVVGAGPMGIAFACGFAETNIKIAIIDKLPREDITNPKIDGREIALTHHSVKILKKINVWRHIPSKSISVIKEARVLDGNSRYFLNFNHQEIQKENLGYLIPNHVIRKNLYKRLINLTNITLINNAEIPIFERIFEKRLSAATIREVFIFLPFDNTIEEYCLLIFIDTHSALFIKVILVRFINLL